MVNGWKAWKKGKKLQDYEPGLGETVFFVSFLELAFFSLGMTNRGVG